MNSSPRIVNIINFIRAVEPREPVDLLEPVVNQVRLLKHHNLPATFLLQYDALLEDRFTSLLRRELDERYDIGAWLEIVQPQVERAGLKWRGRFPWDWHANVGFSIGYTPAERERLIDVLMEQFRAVFGRLPASVGSWFMDAHSLGYLADRYGVTASCWCKDQIGTDGYTVWGGYWNQAYYPSRLNAYMPAQNAERQIPIPVFRMLGSDPIYQYDCGLGTSSQPVVTLEPVYKQAGGSPPWVRWFFDVIAHQPCMAFAYAQAGQENSFGWPSMKDGLTDQFQYLAEQSRLGTLRVQTLADSAKWFAKQFAVTPATAITAMDDWHGQGRRTVWYESRFYRVNLLWEGPHLRIRDIHRFDERYAERYLKETVKTTYCVYDGLPVVDGFQWSSGTTVAGMRLMAGDAPLSGGRPMVIEESEEHLLVRWPLDCGGEMTIRCGPAEMQITVAGRADWRMELTWSPEKRPPIRGVEERQVAYEHNGFAYNLRATKGRFRAVGANTIAVDPDAGGISFRMDERTA